MVLSLLLRLGHLNWVSWEKKPNNEKNSLEYLGFTEKIIEICKNMR